jgi:hypothetical protein
MPKKDSQVSKLTAQSILLILLLADLVSAFTIEDQDAKCVRWNGENCTPLTSLFIKNPIDRTLLEFDISGINIDSVITLDIWYDNLDKDLPDGIIDVFTYTGDGVVTGDDFYAGTLYNSFTAIENNVYNIDLGYEFYEYPCGYASIDITPIVLAAINSGDEYLGIRLSTETSDRFNLGKGSLLPNPFLTVIPEPATILIIGIGSLILRGKK